MIARYLPGDHESALGRDVVLAPPTCCCCCCCCTLVAPEIFGGRQFARETHEAIERAQGVESFWDTQLPFAAGALLFNLLVAPIAGTLGAFLVLATTGVWALLIFGGLLIGVVANTTRLGARVDNAVGGLFWGLALCLLLTAQMVAQVAIVILFAEGLDGDPEFLLAFGGFAVSIPLIVVGLARRRAARERAPPPAEVTPPAPPPS